MVTVTTNATQQSVVQLDSLVVLKIMKHCSESLPDLVSGQLLGFNDSEADFEVTNCFPFPSHSTQHNVEGEVDESSAGARYQIEMISKLKDINADSNAVGWYQSAYLGFLNEPIIFTHYSYQKNIERAIIIVYDPYRSQQGTLPLRAFRLSELFMSIYKPNSPITPEVIKEHGLSHEEMFVELQIEVKQNLLTRTLLKQLEEPQYRPDTSTKLKLGFHTFTEKNLEALIEGTDELTAEQSKYQYYLRSLNRQKVAQKHLEELQSENERRVQEGLLPHKVSDLINNAAKAVTPPNRLDSLLVANQITNYWSS